MELQQQPTDRFDGDALRDLESMLGHSFTDRDLLVTALTHSSFTAENPDATSYERLEFLGDAVLELGSTRLIFSMMVDQTEGEMTKVRASVVDATTLGAIARSLGLGNIIRLGVGEQRSGGGDRDSILSDVMEAVLGAVYLDGGFEQASNVIASLWTDRIVANVGDMGLTDARSHLQERLARTGQTVVYDYERSGPDHATIYKAFAVVEGQVVGTGSAGSKKSAAIAASRDALDAQGEELG